jgi:hypothetical protein
LSAAALIARLGTLGVSVESDGGNLRLRPASAIPAHILADLRAHKGEVLAILAVQRHDDPTGAVLVSHDRRNGLPKAQCRKGNRISECRQKPPEKTIVPPGPFELAPQ